AALVTNRKGGRCSGLQGDNLRGEDAASPLLDAEAARDRGEPGRGGGSAPEPVHRAGGGEERILQDLARVLGVPAHLHAEPEDLRLIAPQDCIQGSLVTTLRR